MMEKTIKVHGMHCNSCESLIVDSLNGIGVKSTANHKKGEVIVHFDLKKVSLEKISKTIEENGYKIVK